MLTTEQLSGVCGVEPTTLRSWVERGVVRPTCGGGRGRGKSHRFDRMRALGLAVAARVYRSEHGCNLGAVGVIVEAFAATRPESLAADFDAGATHFVAVHRGRPVLRGGEPYWVDVRSAQAHVDTACSAACRAN